MVGRFVAMDTHWNPSNAIYGDSPVKTSSAEDCKSLYPNINAIIQSTNLYVYCGNNAVNRIDRTGMYWEELWEYYLQLLENAGGYFAVAAVATQIDSPAVGFADAAGLLMAAIGALAIGGIAILTYEPVSISMSIPETKSKAETKDITISLPSEGTVIFRHNGTNPGNFVPRASDVQSGTGLSFMTYPGYKSAMTTIEAINATGVLLAVQDSPYHVGVFPIGGTLQDWANQGKSSIWTQALLSVIVKCPF